MRPLTGKQRAFIDEYCTNGQNGVQAAKTAGYSGQTVQLGQRAFELVNNSKVKAEIDRKIAEIKAKTIATREQRQQFWTGVYTDTSANMGDRLRASELLGKSEADFTENINAHQDVPAGLTPAEVERYKLIVRNLSKKEPKKAQEAG